jgi:hypothetical protein
MKSLKAFRFWFPLALALFHFSTVIATTVIPPTFEQMTEKAQLIFVGKVVTVRSEWRVVNGKRAIYTVVQFQNEEVLKGNAGTKVELNFLGGTVGETTMEVASLPKFSAGQREVLFVAAKAGGLSPLVGVFHGKFGIRKDQTGRETVIGASGKALRDVSEIAAGPGAEFANRAVQAIPGNVQALSLDEFKTKIRELVAKGGR